MRSSTYLLPFLLILFFVNTHHSYAQSNSIDQGLSPEKSVPLITLTPAESAWLAAHPDIVLGYNNSFEPAVIVDPDGSYRGIVVDFIDALNKRLGIHIALRIDSVPIMHAKAKAKKTDGIALIHPNYADKLGFLKTKTYYRSYPTVFGRNDISFEQPDNFVGKKVAIIDKIYFSEKIIHPYKDRATVLKVKDAREGLDMVHRKKVDLFFGISTNNYLITKHRLFGIAPKYVFLDSLNKFGMAIRPDWPILVSILNKGISSFSEEELDTIVAKWIQPPQQEKQIELTSEEQAWLKAHPIITLGGGNFPPLDFFDETKGQSDGVGPDYARLIGSMLGVEFKLVSGGWQDIQNKAKAKEIDGIRLIFKSKEREKYLNYTKPFLKIAHAIVMKKETKGASSLKELSHKRVGTMQGLYAYHYLKEYYPDMDLITYPTWEKVLRALVNNEVEAVAGTLPVLTYMTNKLFITNLKVTALPTEMEREAYLGIRPDWPELTVIINKAIDAIAMEQHSEIKQKWVGLNKKNKEIKISMTPEEQAWIAQNHKVRIRVVDFPPFMIIKKEGMSGISVDYLKLIAQRTGVDFEFIPKSNPFSESLQGLVNLQGPDLIQCMMKTPERKGNVLFTERYFSAPRVIYTNAKSMDIYGMEDLSGKIISVVRDTVVYEELSKRFPMANYQILNSDLECLKAVATGKADAYIGNLTVSEYLILEHGLSNLKIVGLSSLNDHVFSYGLRRDWPELRSIINKGLNSMTAEEKAVIRRKYLSMKYEHGIRSADVKKWVLIYGSIALIIFFLIIFWNRSLARMVMERTAKLRRHAALLKKSEARFRATFEQAAVGIAHVRMDGNFLRVNKKFCDIIGYPHEETLTLTFQEITHPDDLDRDLVHVDQLLKGEADVYSMEKRYIRKHGESVWIHLTVSILRDDTRKPLFFVSVIKDISERKKLEENIYLYQVRLKSLASQLTLLEEKERKRIAMELHDHIGQTLAFCRIQVAKAKKYAPEQGEQAAILEELSQSLLDTIRDTKDLVFDLSSPLLNELGLSAAIGQWLEEHVHQKHGLNTEFIDDKKTSLMNSDLSAILFRNVRELIANTIKHARATTIIVSMGYHDNELKLSVSDDGIGFDPDKTILPANAHSKFGLFSIKERIEDFGGSFNIISSPGKGCQSIMIVPLLNPMA